MGLTTEELRALPDHAFAVPTIAAKYEDYIAKAIFKTRPKTEKHNDQVNSLFAQGKIDKSKPDINRASDVRRREICMRKGSFTAKDLVDEYGIHYSTITKDLTKLYRCGMLMRSRIRVEGKHTNYYFIYKGTLNVD